MRSAVIYLSSLALFTVVIVSDALPQKTPQDDVTVDPGTSLAAGPKSGPGAEQPGPDRVRNPFGGRVSPNDPSLPILRSSPGSGPRTSLESDSLPADRPHPSSGQDSATLDETNGRFGRPIDNVDGRDLGGGPGTSGNRQEGTVNVRPSRPVTEVGGSSNSRPRRQVGAPGQVVGQPTQLSDRPNPEGRIPTNVRPAPNRNPIISENGGFARQPGSEGPGNSIGGPARQPGSEGPDSPNLNQKSLSGKPTLNSLPCMVRDGSNVETRRKPCFPDSSCSIGPLGIQLNGSNVNAFFCRADEHVLMSLACRLEGVPINALRLHQCAAGDVCSVGPLVIDLPFGQTRIQAFFCNNETVQQPRPNLSM